MTRSRVLSVATVAALALALSATAAPAANDSGVYVDRVKSPRYVLRPEPVTIDYRLAHRGQAQSRQVRSTITLTRKGSRRPSYTKTVREDAYLAGDDTVATGSVAFNDVGVGRYESRVCARAKHKKRRIVDCGDGKDFSVIPFAYEGDSTFTVNFGQLQNSDFRETADTDAPHALFTFSGLSGRDLFEYEGSGSVTYETSGTDLAGCAHSGSASFPIESSKLTLAETLKTYSITGERPQAQTYQATQTCPMIGASPYPAPLYTPYWLFTGTQRPVTPATLMGNYLDPAFGGVWNWTFTARGG